MYVALSETELYYPVLFWFVCFGLFCSFYCDDVNSTKVHLGKEKKKENNTQNKAKIHFSIASAILSGKKFTLI